MSYHQSRILWIAMITVGALIGVSAGVVQAQNKLAAASGVDQNIADNTCSQKSVESMYNATQATTLDQQQVFINDIKIYTELASLGFEC